MSKDQFNQKKFTRLADEWRYVITDMICRAGSGHLGGALSLIEIMATLYHRIMNVDPKNPAMDNRDRLVLSKGHAAPALYCALASRGFFPDSWLGTLNENGTQLPSHADARTVPGIDATTGSLGQGLSVACGMALSAKYDEKNHNIYSVTLPSFKKKEIANAPITKPIVTNQPSIEHGVQPHPNDFALNQSLAIEIDWLLGI